MGKIQESIVLYERLRKYEYRISVENGLEFSLRFGREHYHHLAGFQHLTDMPDIAAPRPGCQKFYSDLKNGKIKEDRILASVKYSQISERVSSFSILEEILAEGSGKIIVQFNPDIPNSLIEARFFLFRREGNPFEGAVTYYSLFLDSAERSTLFYPVSYLVEHSAQYLRDQTLLACTINRSLLKSAKS